MSHDEALRERVGRRIAGLEAALAEAQRERDEARDWVRSMLRDTQVLRCAFCGESYPPGTPESNDDALTAHVKICAKHPMRETERQLAARDALLREARGAIQGWHRGDNPAADMIEVASRIEALALGKPEPDPRDADVARMDWLEESFRECPHMVITANDDPDMGPVGVTINIEGCEPLDVTAPTLREAVDAAIAALGKGE